MIERGDESAGAVFSDCENYRYRLWRVWDESKPKLCFVMLNPSTATHEVLDPTVSRCKKRAEMLGYGGLEVVNIFAYRSTYPVDLYLWSTLGRNPVGEGNDSHILKAASNSGMVICAWGTVGEFQRRGFKVSRYLLGNFGDKTHYLKMNANGSPAHPLYLPYSLQPVLWRVS